jgi:RNA polymerase sigma-70 factor (ECF subfamily)
MPERSPNDLTSLVGRLYDEHGMSLYRYAVMLLADASAAEDAVHQVFTSLLSGGAAHVIEQDLHYLRRAVRNTCYSMLRKRVVRSEMTAEPFLETIAAGRAPVDERLALERGLRSLPPEQREVVHLHLFEGLTFQEVADGSGESINTIASRYRYALAKLRELLA